MVFSSLTFIYIFMPVCLLVYYLAPNIKIKNVVLLIFSLLFYAWGEPIWVSLLIISALVDFTNGKIINKFRGRWQAIAALIASLVINLGLLFSFKYLGFVFANLNLLGAGLPSLDIALPIGISFYTFQTLSYSIDVYRDKAKVNHNFFDFLLFVSLFPQLIAGPILRYTDIQDQLQDRKINIENFGYGIVRFAIGLGKKVLIANYAGNIAAQLLTDGVSSLTVADAWIGILAYTFQIFFDFSGYSDMAIGLGRMFGFVYKENFNLPYTSKSITEFWRRWHISLSSFFRDYVYIPLGGNRRHQIRNLFIVWGLTGLWHGASWNFVLWGLYFCLILIVEKFLLSSLLEKLPKFICWIYTFVLVVIGWVFFYFTDLSTGLDVLGTMFGFGGKALYADGTKLIFINNLPILIISFFVSLGGLNPFFTRANALFYAGAVSKRKWIYGVICIIFVIAVLMLSTVSLVGSSYNPFLYFRF